MMKEFLNDTDARMQKTLNSVQERFRRRPRRPRQCRRCSIASPWNTTALPTPLNQVATIASPDPRQPDHPALGSVNLLKAIEKAIHTSDLGINPQNDGRVIRLNFPQLTEERRKELTKQVKKYAEEAARSPSATSAGTPWTRSRP